MHDVVMREILRRMLQSDDIHGPIGSMHEAAAVICEEYEEFWDEVKLKAHERSQLRLFRELVDIAAVAGRVAAQMLEADDSLAKEVG